MKPLFKLVLLAALGFGWALPALGQNECGLNATAVRGTNGTDSFGVNHQNMCVDDFTGRVFYPGIQSATITGLLSSGLVTAQNFNGDLWVGSAANCLGVSSGAIFYSSMAAAYAASLPGQSIHVCSGWTETFVANLIMNKDAVGFVFHGRATITLNGFGITSPSGTNAPYIITPFIHSTNNATSNIGVTFGLSGTGTAISFGDSSGFVDNARIAGVYINMGGASANAQGILLTNTRWPVLENNACGGGAVSGQKCVVTNGTGGNFAGLGKIENLECTFAVASSNGFCIQFRGASNAWTILAGHGNMGASNNGTTCIDVNGTTSSGVYLAGFDCDVAQTSVTVESTVQSAIFGWIRQDSGSANTANFGANSIGNHIWTNQATTVTDNGVAGSNSVEVPSSNQVNTQNWSQAANSSSFTINDKSDSVLAFGKAAGGATQVNTHALTPFRINPNSGQGIELTESTSPTGNPGTTQCYADSTSHFLKCSYNNSTFFQMAQVITGTSAAFATATTAGTCVQNVTAVSGAATTMAVSVSPVSTPGVGAEWSAFVSSAGNVTINECAVATSAGGTIAFNIRVFP